MMIDTDNFSLHGWEIDTNVCETARLRKEMVGENHIAILRKKTGLLPFRDKWVFTVQQLGQDSLADIHQTEHSRRIDAIQQLRQYVENHPAEPPYLGTHKYRYNPRDGEYEFVKGIRRDLEELLPETLEELSVQITLDVLELDNGQEFTYTDIETQDDFFDVFGEDLHELLPKNVDDYRYKLSVCVTDDETSSWG